MNTYKVECPQHGGAFDCTPFCIICEGDQEYSANDTVPCPNCPAMEYDTECPVCKGWGYAPSVLPCQTCGVAVDTDTWHEELGFCIPCQHDYFDHDNEEAGA